MTDPKRDSLMRDPSVRDPLDREALATGVALDREGRERETLPLVEEELVVGKRQVTSGRVRISTRVETVEEMARTALDSERVEVERVAINREVDAPPPVRTEGDVMIVPVLEEIMVVEKRLVLKEELHIRRQTHTEDVEVPVEVRKQRVEVERISGDDSESQTKEEISP